MPKLVCHKMEIVCLVFFQVQILNDLVFKWLVYMLMLCTRLTIPNPDQYIRIQYACHFVQFYNGPDFCVQNLNHLSSECYSTFLNLKMFGIWIPTVLEWTQITRWLNGA